MHPPTTTTATSSLSFLSSNPDSVSQSHSSSMPKTNPGREESRHQLLLGPEAIPAILSLFELESTTSADLHRALEQARLRVSTGRSEL